jgi:hypothetical protein
MVIMEQILLAGYTDIPSILKDFLIKVYAVKPEHARTAYELKSISFKF